jgi:hypothetical protein
MNVKNSNKLNRNSQIALKRHKVSPILLLKTNKLLKKLRKMVRKKHSSMQGKAWKLNTE